MMIKHTLYEIHYIDRGSIDCINGIQQERNTINHGWEDSSPYPLG